MGSVVTIVCCSGSLGENNVDEEIEDKITLGENVDNYDDSQSQIKMPVLHRSFSERTLPVN
jgi:hypothetical protein